MLASYGSRGDVEPCAALGRELLRRGHDVCIAVPPNLLGFVESAGLAPVAFGSDPPWQGGGEFVRADIPNPIIRTMTELTQEITRALSEWGTTLVTLADGADLLLTGRGERGLAANVAEYYDIPLATLHFFPDAQSPVGVETVLPRPQFYARMARHVLLGVGLVALCLSIGMCGYHNLEKMSWLDAFENASMILS